jgi:hypothetical protein
MRCYDIHARRKTARDILNQIRFDHRFCATCFRQLKHVERPPAEMWGVPDCVIGFEYGTEHAESGEKTRSVDEYGHERLVAHGIVCRCGNGHHAQAEAAMQTRFAYEYLPALATAVDELHAEGKTDATVDVDALDAALTAHVLPVEDAPDSVDWEIVLAAALND